jgi:TfoX/Sxy family transcriptional regulator of competence genes
MARDYFEKLSDLLKEVNIKNELTQSIEVKHYFSGAALYANNTICASWSPVGLAFKLSEKDVQKLIKNGEAKPLKYFPNGHIKKGYALFEKPDDLKPKQCKKYFIASTTQV